MVCIRFFDVKGVIHSWHPSARNGPMAKFNETFFRAVVDDFALHCNAAIYIIVILDNLLVFRVTIPDAVLIQFDLLRMSKILLETYTCRGS
jgi:hypothetical protein